MVGSLMFLLLAQVHCNSKCSGSKKGMDCSCEKGSQCDSGCCEADLDSYSQSLNGFTKKGKCCAANGCWENLSAVQEKKWCMTGSKYYYQGDQTGEERKMLDRIVEKIEEMW